MRAKGVYRRAQITKRACDAAKPESSRYELWDAALPGFGLRVTPAGVKTFILRYRPKGAGRRGTKRFLTLGRYGALTPDQARNEARSLLGDVARGRDPVADRNKKKSAATNTLEAVGNKYLQREAALRSIAQRRDSLERLVYPRLGARPIDSIRRSEIVDLLDDIEDKHGPVMADRTLAALRRLMNWHAARSDEFRTPIVRGMARTRPKERARQRVLTDDELRAIWAGAEAGQGPFGSMIQFILLTAVRRNEAARMTRKEVTNGDWLIPAMRNKSKEDVLVPLSAPALAVLDKVPLIGQNAATGYVFTSDGKRPLAGFSKSKRNFDQACGVSGWVLHDLRRTARTLMSRAGVDSDIAERCLGHVKPGIRATYDVHGFYGEKKRAFEALASQVGLILNPAKNVIGLRGRRNARAVN
jgi:integrase